jgi:hypothetical protein
MQKQHPGVRFSELELGTFSELKSSTDFNSVLQFFGAEAPTFSSTELAACMVTAEAILDTSSSFSEPQTGSDLSPGC